MGKNPHFLEKKNCLAKWNLYGWQSIQSTIRIMNRWKRICFILTGVMLLYSVAFGQYNTNMYTFTVNQNIPEGNPSGLANSQTLASSAGPIVNINVTLDITGGFNGDYYAYLVHDSGFAVLLNRPGVTAMNPVGYADSGMNITLSGAGPTDVHLYQNSVNPNGGMLTGLFAEDGRNVDPATVTDASPRTAFLSSFNGGDTGGQWTLFLADLDYGAQGQLTSWGMVVTTTPEPGAWELMGMGLAGVFALGAWKRRK